LDRIGHPVRLKFIALDGRMVDLEKLHGKVVLLEFWATWCAPCVGGIPQIKTAWDALHKDGFDVIGLSYDTDRAALERFLKKNHLPWPQFFSSKGKDAALIKAFGQPGPPAYWLVDQQGVLVGVNAHQDLEQKVSHLLAGKRSGAASVK
jgi:peroxiredoxin